jgi:hypothetical protein
MHDRCPQDQLLLLAEQTGSVDRAGRMRVRGAAERVDRPNDWAVLALR